MQTEKIWVCDDDVSGRFPVYTRGNVGEVFVEVASPLGWSTYGRLAWETGWRDAFYEMGVFTPAEFKPEGQCEVVGCFGGYVYINMSVTRVMAARIPGMSVDLVDKSLFGDYPHIPPYRPDPRDADIARSDAVSRWLQTLFVTDPGPLTTSDGRRLDTLKTAPGGLERPSNIDLLRTFRSLATEGRHQFKRHVLNGYGANVLVSLLSQICQTAGAAHLAAKLDAVAGKVESAEQSLELWELSRLVRKAPALIAQFEQGISGLLERLSADPAARDFLHGWERFIEHWGFYGPSVWEFRSETYRSRPEIALRMLDRLRYAPDQSAPQMRTAAILSEREAAIAEIAGRLAGNTQVQGQFVAAARAAGGYLAAREQSKMNCARVIDAGRNLVRELGQRLVGQGVLSRWQDVLLVTNHEADAFLADPKPFAHLIAQRAARLEMLAAREPPFVFDGERPPLPLFKERGSSEMRRAAPGSELKGIGVSPGRYTGRARVIRSLEADSELEPGDVIVAASTDASWGPLFLAAGAIVVETGAPVSHAAIVARELGIPAAVSVTDATRRIPDRSIITVDGNTGTVTVQ